MTYPIILLFASGLFLCGFLAINIVDGLRYRVDYWISSWRVWRGKREQKRIQAERRMLPVARLVLSERADVVRLADAIGRRVK